ncbi:uL30 family ribosomal protein [Candidatus Woesearchaeota archaeon]|nr:uL30 family ribosomal protein [Candidatus Woesearchaeota archaeon]
MEKNGRNLAVIRIKGTVGITSEVKATLSMLRLYKKNFCTVVPDNENYNGMVKKVKDFVTWGEISNETLKELIDKRGEEYGGNETDKKGKIKYNKFFVSNGKKLKKFFRLNNPKKGYGRKGIKEVFSKGGALGYRGEKINELIMRMV